MYDSHDHVAVSVFVPVHAVNNFPTFSCGCWPTGSCQVRVAESQHEPGFDGNLFGKTSLDTTRSSLSEKTEQIG